MYTTARKIDELMTEAVNAKNIQEVYIALKHIAENPIIKAYRYMGVPVLKGNEITMQIRDETKGLKISTFDFKAFREGKLFHRAVLPKIQEILADIKTIISTNFDAAQRAGLNSLTHEERVEYYFLQTYKNIIQEIFGDDALRYVEAKVNTLDPQTQENITATFFRDTTIPGLSQFIFGYAPALTSTARILNYQNGCDFNYLDNQLARMLYTPLQTLKESRQREVFTRYAFEFFKQAALSSSPYQDIENTVTTLRERPAGNDGFREAVEYFNPIIREILEERLATMQTSRSNEQFRSLEPLIPQISIEQSVSSPVLTAPPPQQPQPQRSIGGDEKTTMTFREKLAVINCSSSLPPQ